jgi:probable rRNA maturation factor
MQYMKRVEFQIYIRTENAELPVEHRQIKEMAQRAFRYSRKKVKDISLVVCDDQFISRLNSSYTGRSGPTDVLSFSMIEGLSLPFDSSILGDIVISLETAKRQALQFDQTLEQEFLILFIHGLLHLLGYDHSNPEEERLMHQYSQKILAGVKESR